MKALLIAALLYPMTLFAATYYIDYSSGSDSSSGTSKSTPWKRQPYMKGFSGNYTHAAGDRFIFKGRVTWPAACFPLSIATGGSGSTDDYYGVDTTWYSGSGWVKPIFDGTYSVNTLIYIVSNVTIDNLELCHVLDPSDNAGLIVAGTTGNTLIENCHLHGWRLSGSADGAHGGYYAAGYTASTIATNILQNTEIENSENSSNTQAGNGTCVRFGGKVIGCKIHDNSSGILFCTEFTNSQFYNITGNSMGSNGYHTNGIYLDCMALGQTVGYVRGSFIHDVNGGANMAYMNCRGSNVNQYVYNNVFYGVISDQCAIEIEPYAYGSGGTQGNVYVWNNTIVNYNSSLAAVTIVDHGGSPQPNTVQVQNNHTINAPTLIGGGSAARKVSDHNLSQTTAQAAAAGYTLAALYAPPSSSSPSVAIGATTPVSIFTSDILGKTRVAPWDVGAYQYSADHSGSNPAPTPTPTPKASPTPTPTPTPAGNSSLFSASTAPSNVTHENSSLVLGVKFQASAAGTIKAIRFYKCPQNQGTHVATLWSSTGTLLASATFTNETASGWQQVNLAKPVTLTAKTTYIAAYSTGGYYTDDANYFSSTLTSGRLTAPAGSNGVYSYGSSGSFPGYSWESSNYWVDVVFQSP
jgi:uncharacterized protein DUF4082